ncbi:unnamed protein product [Colias eurytheme]|nr:unnamed protein product [Colias eurytheme]
MEYHGRRRRGRPRSNPVALAFAPRQKKSSFFDSICSFLVMSSLMAIIYLLLEHHCSVCSSKCDLHNISKGINEITANLSDMKNSYYDLESKILKFSEELPKIEGQVEVLEALANTLERGDFGWNPKTQLSLPNVDVFLNIETPNHLKKDDVLNFTQNQKEIKAD